MKTITKSLLAMLVTSGSIWALAQEFDGPPRGDGPPADQSDSGGPGHGRDGGPGMRGHHRPPPPPIITALDTNHDGVIDANEIANAPAALKTLDKNGDGQLTFDELRPPRPEGSSSHRHGPPPDDSGPPPNEAP